MLEQAVDRYLTIRRSLGFKLEAVGRYLYDFAQYATERGEMYVVAQTAITWEDQ